MHLIFSIVIGRYWYLQWPLKKRFDRPQTETFYMVNVQYTCIQRKNAVNKSDQSSAFCNDVKRSSSNQTVCFIINISIS